MERGEEVGVGRGRRVRRAKGGKVGDPGRRLR